MKLILNKYDHSVVMQVKLNQGASVIEELLPFDCLNCNGLNFMKLLLNMYEHDVVMHMKLNFIRV